MLGGGFDVRALAGLVGTQNIRNNQSRVGGLDHIVKSGVIVEAVDNQPWSGESNVHVSIVNWVKLPLPQGEGGRASGRERETGGRRARKDQTSDGAQRVSLPPAPSQGEGESAMLIPGSRRLWSKAEMDPELFAGPVATGHKRTTTRGKRGGALKSKSYELAAREVGFINSALSDQVPVESARALACNKRPQTCFQGVNPAYDGFVVSHSLRNEMVKMDLSAKEVVKPFLIGRDMVSGGIPSRSIIDFGAWDMIRAQQLKGPFEHVRKHVLPAVRKKAGDSSKTDMADARAEHLQRWWQFWNVRQGMRRVLEKLPRYIACARVTKRPVFCFVSREVLPDGALQVFAFSDDYSFGVLQSGAHWLWFTTKCSKLTERFRYTPETVFDTFPWPQAPTKGQVRAVAEAGREVRRVRAEALKGMKGGLRALYRTLELPGRSPLKEAHAALDAAVLEAYGFSSRKDLLAQLLALNLEVAAKEERGEAVTPPGVPGSYGDAADLISADCIEP